MTTVKENVEFQSDGNKLKGVLVYPNEVSSPVGVLFIHGSGKEKTIYQLLVPWQEYLAERGISSLSFHCRGVHDSEGSFEDASLNNRLKDSEAALEHFLSSGHVDPTQVFVHGTSMGGHVIVRLLEKHPEIKGLMMEGGAAYSTEAEDKKMDQTFTDAIRKENSWVDSPAFDILQKTDVPLLLIYGEFDTVIPDGIKDKYRTFVKSPKDDFILKGGDHGSIRGETPEQKALCQEMYEATYDFLKKYSSAGGSSE